MYSFFLSSDFPENAFSYDPQTYRVLTGHGVLIKANEAYQYVATDGLRSCVAFALINIHDATVLLVHFYNLAQVKNGLKTMCDAFLEETTSNTQDVICIIAGGRDYCAASMDMVDYICHYVKEHLTPLKLRLNAPIVAKYEETLSLKIDFYSGISELSLNTLGTCSLENSSPTTTDDSNSTDESLAFEPITFINMVEARQRQVQILPC